MAKVAISCAQCGRQALKEAGGVNRARRQGMNLYCGRHCAGLSRRSEVEKTDDQKRAEKAAYDAEYRARNAEWIKARKAEHHTSTYDPVSAAVARKKRLPQHVEYCRRPEYRAYKKAYDLQRRADEYGGFAESYILLLAVDKEVNARMSDYDVRIANGTLNKRLKRRREYTSTYGHQPKGHAVGYSPVDQGRPDATQSGRRHRLSGERDPAYGQDAIAGRGADQTRSSARHHRIRGKVNCPPSEPSP